MKKVIPISEVCDAQQFTEETRVQISTGHNVITAPGDWLIRNTTGSVFVIPDKLFRKTYRVIEENDFSCTCKDDSGCGGHIRRLSRPAAWEEPETPR